jgi:branched-chain amino acid transport system permease protein
VSTFVNFSILGIPYGCVYALIAIGLVLTYKTSGVYNLAFSAQAYVSAAIFYVLVLQSHWNKGLAFLVAVVITGPVVGLVLDRGLFRYIRTANPNVKLVSSLGLLVGIPPAVQFLWPGEHFNPPSLSPNPNHVYRAGSYYVNGNQVIVMVVTVLAALALAALFRYTAIGLKMRAVVESPRMAELSGVNSERVSMFSWMLSSFLAALAGVLLAPYNSNLNDTSGFITLLVVASAAAAFGGMFSLPMTLLGGVLLGVTYQGLLTGYLPLGSVFAKYFRPAVPFIIRVLLLLFWPPLRQARKKVTDPLASCDPPPPAPLSMTSRGTLRWINKTSFPTTAIVFVVVSLFVVSAFWQFLLTQILVFGIVFLSINMLTGLSGQLSLCQWSFGGLACFVAGQLVAHYNLPILLGLVVGAAIAAAAGALVALPSLRLEGLYLSLATLAFALLADNSLYLWLGNGEGGLSIPRPKVGSLDFGTDRSFFLLSLVILVICGLVFGLVKRGTTGRFLAAMRGSEVAATTIGINPVRLKITIFALSAAIAGVGGVMYGSLYRQVSATDFNTTFSLVFLVLVLTTGSRTVEGATNGAFGFVMLQQIFKGFGLRWSNLPVLLFGLGALGYAKHPEGVGDYQKDRSLVRAADVLNRYILRIPAQAPGPAPAAVSPAAPGPDGRPGEVQEAPARSEAGARAPGGRP